MVFVKQYSKDLKAFVVIFILFIYVGDWKITPHPSRAVFVLKYVTPLNLQIKQK